jgi:glycerophosphoryl diester phosphodiesterase
MARISRLLVLGALALLGNSQFSPAAEGNLNLAAARVARPQILVIAHRGDSKVAPENTLPAFASAVKAGADLVELDYYHSADGLPVVFHDADLDRTTNAVSLWGASKVKIGAKSLAELKELDAGAWFKPQFAGTRIPTLNEALDTIQPGSMTLIERKGGDPATCVELLRERNLLDQVVVQAFDWEYLEGCHKLAPDLVLAALGHNPFKPEQLDQIANTGARIVAWEDRYTDASTVDAIHARGWKAWVWTVDKPQRVTQLVGAKIDGIITNQPAATRAAIEAAQQSAQAGR